jgi:hypothetical protein
VKLLRLGVLLALAAAPVIGQQPAAASPREERVVACGIAHRCTISYEAAELRARPVDSRTTPLQVVVERGSAPSSWDLEVVGFEAGRFDVARFLERADGTPASDLPAIPVQVVSLLPPGLHLDLETRESQPVRLAGRPTWLWPLLAALWLALPVAWLVVRRMRRRRASAPPSTAAPAADPLDELAALVGQRPLTTAERARLEMLLLRRLGEASGGSFGTSNNPYLVARSDPVGASIVEALESWLHHPQPPAEVETRLAEALRRLPRASAAATPPAEVRP